MTRDFERNYDRRSSAERSAEYERRRATRSRQRVVIDGRPGAQRREEEEARAQATQRANGLQREMQQRSQRERRPRDGQRTRDGRGERDGYRSRDEHRVRGDRDGRDGYRTAAAGTATGRSSGRQRADRYHSQREMSQRDISRSADARRSLGRQPRSSSSVMVQPGYGLPESSWRNRIPLVAIIAAAVVVVLIVVFAVRSCSGGESEKTGTVSTTGASTAAHTVAGTSADVASPGDTSSDIGRTVSGTTSGTASAGSAAGGTAAASANKVASARGDGRVSFAAVGDNLPDDLIGYWADAQAGEEGDGTYDYRGLYRFIKPYIQAADLAYMKEETHLGGNEIGPRGYPSFNVTDEMADAVVDTGFDFVASASNHAYDWGLYGALENSLKVWESKPVAFTGTSVTEEQYNRIARLECNGITFALLDYTYGVNWPDEMELPEHAINIIDKDRIAADVARAKKQADVVLVAMHWGTELLMEADDEQQDLAQFLANLDVDVVLGSHPHVIGPVAWVKNENGSGHETLVAYSLGNFLSDHEARSPQVELEGMLCCDFVRDDAAASGSDAGGTDADANANAAKSSGSTIKIENVKWVPLVNHTNGDRTDFAVYAVKDYSNKLGKLNGAYEANGVSDPMKWLRDTTREVVGTAVPIDDGTGDGTPIVTHNARDAFKAGVREGAVAAAMADTLVQA